MTSKRSLDPIASATATKCPSASTPTYLPKPVFKLKNIRIFYCKKINYLIFGSSGDLIKVNISSAFGGSPLIKCFAPIINLPLS